MTGSNDWVPIFCRQNSENVPDTSAGPTVLKGDRIQLLSFIACSRRPSTSSSNINKSEPGEGPNLLLAREWLLLSGIFLVQPRHWV